MDEEKFYIDVENQDDDFYIGEDDNIKPPTIYGLRSSSPSIRIHPREENYKKHLKPNRPAKPFRNISDTGLYRSSTSTQRYTNKPSGQTPSQVKIIREQKDIEILEREQKLRELYFIQSNGWNDNLEKDIKKIGDKSEGWRWMHKKSAQMFARWYRWWGTINVIISGLLAAGNIPNILTCQSQYDALKWVVVTFQFLVTASLGAAQFLDYGARRQNHKTAESGFSVLFFHIKTQLNMDRKSRQNGEHYAEWIQKEYTELSSNPDIPGIPGNIYKAYLRKIEGTGIANIDDLDSISIYKDPPGIIFSGVVTPKNTSEPPTHQYNAQEDTNDITITVPKPEMSGIDKWNLRRHYQNE